MDLFEFNHDKEADVNSLPPAEKLRPQELRDFLFTSRRVETQVQSLLNIIEKKGVIPSLILWGPPGSGKTTLAQILSKLTGATEISINAVSSGAKQLKSLGEEAHNRKIVYGKPTVLFIDEIHRLNRAQQDVLLPHTEKGDFTLIGATTENPGYEINAALASRCRIIQLERHSEETLDKVLHSMQSDRGQTLEGLLNEDQVNLIKDLADGDARKFINLMTSIFDHLIENTNPISSDELENLLSDSGILYDKSGDQHYNCISAFIKSIRGSDPNAAIYYLARMLHGGEDPKFIARRLVILASEDIGNADPRALSVAVDVFKAVEVIGMPECRINLAQAVTYLASAPKSNRSYIGIDAALAEVKKSGSLDIPDSLKSARNHVAEKMGFGKGYKYSHDGRKGFQAQEFLPKEIRNQKFYEAGDRGFEKKMKEYLAWMRDEEK
ncbi:MAG: recombination factor protein RarA [Bdellovibrionaceae bacterium]|nr:recombination factor protein RarA [Pseudobdellovibrionaceae bacterium]|tara:strand:- start:4711 stop:6027 length:1317 start_codon:yes stop_codon:yes gene_type:complete